MTDCEFGYTLTLAQDYVKHVLQIPQPGSAPSRASQVLRDVASSVQGEVEKNLKPCLDSFDVVSVDSARTIFNQVMEKEFEDGIINWGRIVTIFAFEGILTKKLLQERISPDVDASRISYFVAEFITTNMREWIRQNGGWVRTMGAFFTALSFDVEMDSFLLVVKNPLFSLGGLFLKFLIFKTRRHFWLISRESELCSWKIHVLAVFIPNSVNDGAEIQGATRHLPSALPARQHGSRVGMGSGQVVMTT